MSPILPLLLTPLLATLALPGHASEGPAACPSPETTPVSHALQRDCASPPAPAHPRSAPVRPVALDCNPFALGGLASGPAASGLHASQLVQATIRHCSLRGYLFGVAMHAPEGRRASRT